MSRAWMPLYVGDYLRDTRDLNTLQHGAYLLLIMHYWQHDALPTDDARLAAIAGVSVAQWRRIREPVQAKFSEGWRHKRIDAELAKVDRAFMQRRLAGRNGGIKSGIARAVAQGEAIILAQARAQARGEAEGKRALARRASEPEAGGAAARKPPRTNHNQNHNFSSSTYENRVVPEPGEGNAGNAPPRSPNQWSRQELDALFAGRVASTGDAPAPQEPAPQEPTPEPTVDTPSSNKQTGG